MAIISPNFRGKNRLQIQEMIAKAISGRSGLMMAIEPIGYTPEEYDFAEWETFLGEIKETGRQLN